MRESLLLRFSGFAAGLFVTLALSPASASDNIASVPIDATLTESKRYPADMVAPGDDSFDGSYQRLAQYETADGEFVVALWESGPGTLVSRNYPAHEYGRVLEGRLTVVNEDGSTADYGPGDSLVIPRGWNGEWRMHTRFKKQFVAYRPRVSDAAE